MTSITKKDKAYWMNYYPDTAEMKEALFKQGLEPQTNTPEQFAAFIRSELAENARLIKASDIKAE